MQKRHTTKDLSQKRLKELLHYDPDTGIFTWRVDMINASKGQVAGSVTDRGYISISVDKKPYRSGRLAFYYMMGYFPENDVDHENRVRDDDKWSNLREASPTCNSRNRKIRKNNTSGVTGVSFDKVSKKWMAYIAVFKKSIALGRFYNKTEAVTKRWEAEKKYDWPTCCTTSSAYLYLKKRNLA